MLISIEHARHIDGHRIWVQFNTGEAGETDLSDLVWKYPAAAPLRDPVQFALFRLDTWPTLVWDCGFDVSPETLYERVTGRRVTWDMVDTPTARPTA